MRKYQSRILVEEDGLATMPGSGDLRRSLSSFWRRRVAAICSVDMFVRVCVCCADFQ